VDRVLATIMVAVIATLSLTRYQRLNGGYDQSRPALPSDRSFRYVYKIMVGLSGVASLLSYWWVSPGLFQLHDNVNLRILGSVISGVGIVGFESSVRALGSQYSPCFDLRIPTERIVSGPYRYLSHPIYVSNATILGGLVISSGSLWVFLSFGILVTYYWRSAIRERQVFDEQVKART
jgi:protein-S-isoprenylcysteine O-methyltransferase Ste14